MPFLTLYVRNAELVHKGLRNLSAAIPKIARSDIEGVHKRVIKQMQDYPPERPAQKYVRTYEFKKTWRIKPTPKGARLSSSFDKSMYVVGDAVGKGQAWMHVGRWLLFRDVVDYEMTKLNDTVEKHIVVRARQEGF